MARKKKFKLVHHEPFLFEGDRGEYEIPPLEKLAFEDWRDVAEIVTKNEADTKTILDAYKNFFLNVCPGLAEEAIGDNQWLQFGSAYFEAMGE